MERSIRLLLPLLLVSGTISVRRTTTTNIATPNGHGTPLTNDNGSTNFFLRNRITSLFSPIIGDRQLTTIGRVERAEAERGEDGVWMDLEVAKDYFIGREEGSNDRRGRRRRRLGSIDLGGVMSMFKRERVSMSSSDENKTEERDEEHPMRTDEWLVKVKLSPLMLPRRKATEASLFPQSTKRYMDGNGDNKLYRDGTIPDPDQTQRRDQMMKFSRNGYVVLMEDTDHNESQNDDSHDLAKTQAKSHNKRRRMTRIGKWRLDTAGISWDIPVRIPTSLTDEYHPQNNNETIQYSSTDKTITPSSPTTKSSRYTTLHYRADIHLSKFQQQPRMIRGTITRDRWIERHIPLTDITLGRRIFRPVIGTFSAEGVGKDTIDVTYRGRSLGLDSGGVGKAHDTEKF